MGKQLLSAPGWIIGPTIWISSVVLMIHGLWTGAWYGYIFGLIWIVALGSFLGLMHRSRQLAEEAAEHLAREWNEHEGLDEY
jgi:hypothetical protein